MYFINYLEMAENIVNNSWPIVITWCEPEKSFRTQLAGIDFTPVNISVRDSNSYFYMLSQVFKLFTTSVFSLNYVKKNTAIKFWHSVTLAIVNSNEIIVTQSGLHLILHMLKSTSHRQFFDVRNKIDFKY